MKITRPEQHYDMVEVIWDDAAGFRDGWKDKLDPLEPQLAISVGFLIVDDPDHIVIAGDTDTRGAHNGRTQIPRGMVKKIRILKKKDKSETRDSKAGEGKGRSERNPSVAEQRRKEGDTIHISDLYCHSDTTSAAGSAEQG